MKIDKTNPSPEQLAALITYPANTPLVIVNIIKYRNQTETGKYGKKYISDILKMSCPSFKK